MARLEECERLSDEIGDRASRAYAYQMRGTATVFRGDLAAGIGHFENAIAAHRAVGADDGLLGMLFQLAMTLCYTGDSDRARRVCEQAVELSSTHGERWGRSYALWVLAFETWNRGDAPAAVEIAREALAIKQEFTDQVGAALVIELLAWIAASRAEFTDAGRLLGAARSIWRHVGTSVAVFGPQLAEYHAQCERQTRRALRAGAFAAVLAKEARCTVEQSISRALDGDTWPHSHRRTSGPS